MSYRTKNAEARQLLMTLLEQETLTIEQLVSWVGAVVDPDLILETFEGQVLPEPPERNFEAEAHEARYESPDSTPYVSYYDKGYGDAEDWLEIEPPSDDDGLDGISNDIYPDPDDLFVPTDLGG